MPGKSWKPAKGKKIFTLKEAESLKVAKSRAKNPWIGQKNGCKVGW